MLPCALSYHAFYICNVLFYVCIYPDRDHMVVGFITTYAISTYYH